MRVVREVRVVTATSMAQLLGAGPSWATQSAGWGGEAPLPSRDPAPLMGLQLTTTAFLLLPNTLQTCNVLTVLQTLKNRYNK